jgi:hypothetical protein
LTILALAMTMLLGFVGYATDTGMIWVTRTQLQHSVDAAALAAAQELPSSTAAQTVACEYIELNAVTGMTGTECGAKADVTSPTAHEVKVTTSRTVAPIFGQLIGMTAVEVVASATARIGSLGSTCVFPLFLTTDQVTNSPEFFVPVKFAPANTAIDVDNGSQAVREAMEDLECDEDGGDATSFTAGVGSSVDIKPGSATQFEGGWEAIADQATSAGSSCPNQDVSTYVTTDAAGEPQLDPTLTTENCPRLILVPVLPPGNYGGNSSGVIEGFIAFYFAEVCSNNQGCPMPNGGTVLNHQAWGYFVQIDVTSATFTDYDPESGTKIVSLAE